MSEHCHNCDEEVMPIDGDCPMCGRNTSFRHGDATLVVTDGDGNKTEVGQLSSLSMSTSIDFETGQGIGANYNGDDDV